jgi:hypothetical protein
MDAYGNNYKYAYSDPFRDRHRYTHMDSNIY